MFYYDCFRLVKSAEYFGTGRISGKEDVTIEFWYARGKVGEAPFFFHFSIGCVYCFLS